MAGRSFRLDHPSLLTNKQWCRPQKQACPYSCTELTVPITIPPGIICCILFLLWCLTPRLPKIQSFSYVVPLLTVHKIFFYRLTISSPSLFPLPLPPHLSLFFPSSCSPTHFYHILGPTYTLSVSRGDPSLLWPQARNLRLIKREPGP